MATSQSRSLDNEEALVTGATSGIGRAIALQLAREGADVIVDGRDAQRGEKVVQEIRSPEGQARLVAADLRNGGGGKQSRWLAFGHYGPHAGSVGPTVDYNVGDVDSAWREPARKF